MGVQDIEHGLNLDLGQVQHKLYHSYFFSGCYCDPKDIHRFVADLGMEADVRPLKYIIATPND